jgi:hypothetical protein
MKNKAEGKDEERKLPRIASIVAESASFTSTLRVELEGLKKDLELFLSTDLRAIEKKEENDKKETRSVIEQELANDISWKRMLTEEIASIRSRLK